MSQVTITVSNEHIEQMKVHYKPYLQKPPQGAVFRARTNDATITAYRSGKVLFQGQHYENEANKWAEQQIHSNKQPTLFPNKDKTTYFPPEQLFTASHIGSDESGTGDYFGPVTTCAVYVDKNNINRLKEMGVQDSKSISDANVHILAKEIIQLQIPYSLLILHNEKYNDLQQNGWTQGKMKAMLHQGAIQGVLKKINDLPYEGIIVDQFCTPEVYKRHITSEGERLPDKSFFMTKAEDYSIAVAAGSVIARASFLNEMERLTHACGFDLLKGASQKVDRLIASIIQEKGETFLPTIAKVHFANTKKARKYM